MREFKFRGKDFKGEWVYGYLVKDNDGVVSIIKEKLSDITCCMECGVAEMEIVKVDPETVGQFITRENDYEIYEGDLIKEIVDEVPCILRAIYDKELCRYFLTDGPNHYDFDEIEWDQTKKVGNIYENPELLR